MINMMDCNPGETEKVNNLLLMISSEESNQQSSRNNHNQPNQANQRFSQQQCVQQ